MIKISKRIKELSLELQEEYRKQKKDIVYNMSINESFKKSLLDFIDQSIEDYEYSKIILQNIGQVIMQESISRIEFEIKEFFLDDNKGGKVIHELIEAILVKCLEKKNETQEKL